MPYRIPMRLYKASVFHPVKVLRDGPKAVLSILFHRSAATLYLIYSIWAFGQLFQPIPSLAGGANELVQYIFPFFVLLASVPACIGATFWPRLARLEMFAGSSFVAMLGVYLIYLGFYYIGEGTSFASWILNVAHVVVPAARVAYIYLTLIRTADAKANGGTYDTV